MFDTTWLAAPSPQKVVRKCWLNRSIKMESDCSKKMAILHSREKQKGNGLRLCHGKLWLDTKNSLSEVLDTAPSSQGRAQNFL